VFAVKSLSGKLFAGASRFEPLLLIIPFIGWIFCFRYFFTGHLRLEADAISYADHIGFYTDNLSRGVYPLWDPTWFSGAPNDFFLRRLGDVNPFLLLIVALKWCGVSSTAAYLAFIGAYYFLSAWGFYRITRLLLADIFAAFTAYVLLLFSSWGCEIFYNYIIILFAPLVWFFYFLLCFFRRPQKAPFLGMCFCAGLLLTTYIPFLFLIILAIFIFFFVCFYGSDLAGLLKRWFGFFRENKIFSLFCAAFLVIACIPGFAFYLESKGGEYVLPNRHSGASASSAVAVGLENAVSGDLISHGYFDRLFDDHANIDMGDIYVPYVFFLVLLATFWGRVNKLVYFLLFNILALSLITVTSAAGMHRFLYDHIIFFKFIRQVYYFFWLAMLPMAILLAAAAFQLLLRDIDVSTRKMTWLAYIIICHLLFIWFLWGHKGVLPGAWAAVMISLFYFAVNLCCAKRVSYPAGFCAVLLAVFVQSVQVYACLDDKLFKYQTTISGIPQTQETHRAVKLDLYYAARWFNVLVEFIDPAVLEKYRSHKFIVYDNVVPYTESAPFFKVFESTLNSQVNVAYVPKFETSADDWKSDSFVQNGVDVDPLHSGKLTVLRSDANTWVLRARFPDRKFLVINDNFNSDWNAFINGQRVRFLRANVAFKGLWVPAGDSEIVVRFSSPWHYFLHVTLIGLFAGTFLSLLMLLRRKEHPKAYA
jgi:hypothetical protein